MLESTSRNFCVLALLVAALGAGPTDALAQQADGADASAQADAPDSQKADDVSGQQLLEEAADIADEVADIRGLALQEEIKKGIRNREQLRKVLIEKLAEEVTDADVENEAKVFKQLGLMPQDLDYKQTLLDVLTEQIAGFYDQHAKELYIMQGIPLSLQRPAMAHEIFHAIQDQHFDIRRMVEPLSSKENGDFALARSALIEGDASVLMIDFSMYERGVLPREGVRSVVDIPPMAAMLKMMTQEDVGALQQMVPQPTTPEAAPIDPAQLTDSALAGAPRMVRKLLVFPYFAGMRFIIDVRANSSWKQVNKIYGNAPVSTEQILHPKRYFQGDQPVHLDYTASPVLDEDSLIYDSVFGEYQMRLVLEEHLLAGEDPAKEKAYVDEAMLGWDGDRILAFEREDGHVVLSQTSVWDTLDDAREYFDALAKMLEVRFPEATLTHSRGKHGQSICLSVGEGADQERFYIEQWGDLVLHIEGAPSELDADGRETDATAYMLREQIMRSLKRTPFEKVLERKIDAYEAERAEAAAQ